MIRNKKLTQQGKIIVILLLISTLFIQCNSSLIDKSQLIGDWTMIEAQDKKSGQKITYPIEIRRFYLNLMSDSSFTFYNGLKHFEGLWSEKNDTLNLNTQVEEIFFKINKIEHEKMELEVISKEQPIMILSFSK